LGILRHLRLGGAKTGDFYRVADRVKRVPEAEIAVTASALAGGGPLADILVRQLREAPDVYRLRAEGGGYELRVSTVLEVDGVPRDGWRTGPIPVETGAGRRLHVEVVVHEAGIIGIEGRTEDRERWPVDWRVSPDELQAIEAGAPWLALPDEDAMRDGRVLAAEVVHDWLGRTAAVTLDGHRVVVRPPATEGDLDALAERATFALPEAYAALLRSTDGVDIDDLSLLGTADAYRLDIPGAPRLVICPPDEDGAVVLGLDGRIVHIDIDDPGGTGRLLAEDLRSFVASRLGR
jgi:hypothetical protein